MRKLLTVLVASGVFFAVEVVGHSDLVAVAAAQQVTTIEPHDLQPVPDPATSN